MKPILWVLVILYLADLALSAPSQTTSDVLNSKDLTQDEASAEHDRAKRASRTGQTQSQYLNFGDSQTEGKADAEITRYGSRASVSGSNGMGQAQSQSSGSGCDECYGSENGYSHGGAGGAGNLPGPDPLRSSSGSSSGLLSQSQTSSGLPQTSTGYDIYGRPIAGGSTIGTPSGYSSQGFGPTSGGRSPSERIKDAYSHGYPSGIDSQPGAFGNNGFPSSSGTDQGGHKTPSSNLGSSSFLNRPIGNGKPSGWQVDTTGGRPSILAGRKPGSNGSDAGKIIDGTSGGSQPGFGPSHDGGSTTNGRGSSGRPSGTNLPSYNQVNGGSGSPDTSSTSGRSQPIRSGTYDTSSPTGYPDNGSGGRSQTQPTGLQPIDHSRKQPGDAYGKTHRPGSNGENGSGSSSGAPSSDVFDGLRNIFKLPPGLCLVRCDTVRPGQSLTPDQIRDTIESGGQPSKAGQYVQPGTQTPQIGTTGQYPQGGQGGVSSGQYPHGGAPSGGQYPGQQPTYTQGGAGQFPQGGQGAPSGQFPQGGQGAPSGQFPQGGGAPTYTPGTLPQGSYPGQTQQGISSYPQGAGQGPAGTGSLTPSYVPAVYPQGGSGGIPTGQIPIQTGGQYVPSGYTGGAPGAGGAGTIAPGQQPSYTQGGTGQFPQGGAPSGQFPQGGVAPVYTPGTLPGALPQGGQLPGGYSQYPTTSGSQIPSGSQIISPGQTQPGIATYPQGQIPTGSGSFTPYVPGQIPTQTGAPSGQYVPSGYPTQGGGQQFPTSPGQISAGAGSQSGAYIAAQLPQGGPGGAPSGQYPQGGAPTGGQYPGQQQQPTYTQGVGGQYPQGGPGGAPSGQYPQGGQGGAPSGQYPQGGQGGALSGQFPQGGTGPTYAPGTLPGSLPQGGQLPGGYSQYPTTSGSQIPSGSQVIAPGQGPAGTGSLAPSYIPGSQPGVYPQGGGSIPTGQIPPQAGTTSGQYVPAGYPTQSGVAPGTGGAGTIASGGYTQSGGAAQYPSATPAVYPQGGAGQGVSQGQSSRPTTGGAGYLPQYPTASTGLPGGYGGVPTYQTPGYTGQIGGYPTGYPGGAIDSTGAQTGQGVPANYVTGGTTSGSVSGEGEGGSGGASGGEDDGLSQAESSIKNGEVIASAQGTKNGGTAQTQVQGTYSGSGSFSASAQTADKDRSAQAQVSGHKDGALSSSQGSGGKSQAQAQVEVNEKTGGTSASGQSSGLQHSSQSEVTANEKGGLADAQSSGPGQTSSQAQIGFKPEGGSTSQGSNIFNGGGQASAQSGVHSGLSQSQIQGNFKYGISYHGAAQAASGTKEQVTSYREKSKKLFQSIGQFSRSNRDAVTSAPVSDIANINDIGSKPKQTSFAPDPTTDPDSSLEDADYEADEGEDEYDDEYENSEKKNATRKPHTKSSRMEIELPQRAAESEAASSKSKSTGVTVITESTPQLKTTTKLVRMPAVRSETVPNGFKGKIEDKRQKHNLTSKNQLSNDETKVDVKPDTYVTVTKSISGSLDNAKATPTDDKKFESTYYTKSSTCGFFSFSCNIVYGSNGRSKICRPKQPTNGKC